MREILTQLRYDLLSRQFRCLPESCGRRLLLFVMRIFVAPQQRFFAVTRNCTGLLSSPL
jgi:hypothetical protein